MSNNDEAIEYLNESLSMKYEIYDQFDLSIADTYKQMAIAYENLNDLKKSNKYLDLIVEIYLKNYDDDDQIIAETLVQIANNYKKIGEYNQAVEYFKRALTAYKIIHAENAGAEIIATCLKSIGYCYIHLRDFTQSNDFLNEALRVLFALNMHEQVGGVLNTIGVNLQQMGDYYNSLGYLTKAIYIYGMFPSEEKKAEFALAFVNMANNYRCMGDFKKSTDCLNQALALYIDIMNKSVAESKDSAASIVSQSNVADTYSHIAINYLNQKDYTKSVELFTKSFDIYVQIFDKDHLAIAQVCSNLGTSYQLVGDFEKSIEFYNRSIGIFKKIHSNDLNHVNILTCLDNLDESKRLLHWKRNYALSVLVYPIKTVMSFLSKALHVFTQVPNNI